MLSIRSHAALITVVCLSTLEAQTATFLDFGSDFIFGLAMDAYQFEGHPPLTATGTRASAIDTWCQWDMAQNKSNSYKICGDVAAGFLDHMEDDVKLMAELGQKHLFFAISWPRMFPNGNDHPHSKAALEFYTRLVDALLANGITPWIALHVFDYPQVYNHQWGGWVGKPMVAQYRKWADFVFEHFADRVEHFFSFHEPDSLCSTYANPWRFVSPRPNANDSTVIDYAHDHYNCQYHMLLAHGQAAASLREYETGATTTATGSVINHTLSICSGANWAEPNTTSAADAAASNRMMVWQLAAWMDPLVFGDWPPEMREGAGERLPKFSEAESASLKGSVHFLGADLYTTSIVAAKPKQPFPCEYKCSHKGDASGSDSCIDSWCDERCGPPASPNPKMDWLRLDPAGLRKSLEWMSRRYPGYPLLVTESGVGLDGGSRGNPLSSGVLSIDTADKAKIDILKQYWHEAYKAKNALGVNLQGIFHWSFLDNLEWDSGFSAHFGMVHVNHTRDDLQRTPKASAHWYRSVVQQSGFSVEMSDGAPRSSIYI